MPHFSLSLWIYACITGAVASAAGLVFAAFVPTPFGPNATWYTVTGLLAVVFAVARAVWEARRPGPWRRRHRTR